MKKFWRWTFLILWMAVIFAFSSQPGDVSEEQSKLVIYVFNLLGLNLNSMLGELSSFIVRKGAHFTEYFILYMLTYNAIKDDFKLDKALILSVIVVFLYACSDEFHQSFVPGRGPAFRDVLIDTSGGITAAGFLYVFNLVKLKRIKG
jgi:VanZ family protein